MNSHHPVLVIVRGVPGSGKSYLTRRIAESIGDDKVVVLDPDTIDIHSDAFKQFTAPLISEGVDEKFYPFRYLRQRGFDAILDGKIIIWNQAFIDLKGFQITVDRLTDFAKEHDINLPLLVVEVEIDPDVAKSRIAERVASGGHDVPQEKLNQFIDQYESFSKYGYATVTIDGTANIDESLRKILDLDSLQSY